MDLIIFIVRQMITLKITTEKKGRDFEKIGNYYVYFDGKYTKKIHNGKSISLRFNNRLWGHIDKEKRIIEIFRDIEGGLPLYYFGGLKKLIISSHISFFRKEGLNLEENKEVIAELLNYGYILPPSTIYKNIFKVPLLKNVIIKLNKKIDLNEKERFRFNDYQKHDARPHPEGLPFGQIRLRRSGVWQRRSCFGCSGSDPSFKAGVSIGPRHEKRDYKEIEDIEEGIKFDKNKKYTLLFSGGLYSSILCKLMKKQKIEFNMLSTGFNFNKTDLIEKRYSLSSSNELKKKTKYLSFDFSNLLLLIPKIVSITEEPISHIQTLLVYELMKSSKQKRYSIFVSGQGADGIFGTESQFNFLKNNRKLDILKVKIPEFNFLDADYKKKYKENKEDFLERIKKHTLLNKDFILDLEGDVDSTINSWTKCANYNSSSIMYPLFKKEFIEKMIKLKWKNKLREPKLFLR